MFHRENGVLKHALDIWIGCIGCIGNMYWIFETKIGYWKHRKAFGNIICILETSLPFGNTRILETYNERSLTKSHVKYTIMALNIRY